MVGGGPSGLVLALLLAKAGISVEVLEASDKLDDSPRASFYPWPALYELKRAGLLEEIRKRGYVASDGISWRKVDGTLLCKFQIDAVPQDYRLHALPLGRLNALLKEHIDESPNVEIKYLHKVTRLDQSEESARVFVETPQGEQVLEADYIVGCDGANSQVRRSLFGDKDFPGRTWDVQLVATNVNLPLLLTLGYSHVLSVRSTTTLQATGGVKEPSSSTRCIGLWRPRFSQMVYFVSVMERKPDSLERSILLVNQRNSVRSCRALHLQINTNLSA